MRFRPGLCLRPRWESSLPHDAAPDSLVGWGEDTLSYPAFGARHVSPRIPAYVSEGLERVVSSPSR